MTLLHPRLNLSFHVQEARNKETFLGSRTWVQRQWAPSCAPAHIDSDQEYFRSLTATFLSLPHCRMIGKAYLTKERSEYYPLLGR